MTGETKYFEVNQLTVPFKDQLTATNPQYIQSGKYLFIAGGYGKEKATNKFVTFPILTAVDLDLLTQKMISNNNPSEAFIQLQDENMRVCGGELEKMGDYFYLVGGHNFGGLYTEDRLPTFTQVYNNEIKKFKINIDRNQLFVTEMQKTKDEFQLHRRDFSMAPIMLPSGKEGLGIYGGVFRKDQDLPYYNPIYIEENKLYSVDLEFEQTFSHYTCPVVPIYDLQDNSMYSVFFAGLSANYIDGSGKVSYDARVPFVKDITALKKKSNGKTEQFVLPVKFDTFLGTNMIYVPSENAPMYANEVLKLRDINSKVFIGYLYGGIKADIPNLTPSRANNRIFKLFLKPQKTGVTTSVIPTTIKKPWVKIYPNPMNNNDELTIESDELIQKIEIVDLLGRTVFKNEYHHVKIVRINSLKVYNTPEIKIVNLYTAKGKKSERVLW